MTTRDSPPLKMAASLVSALERRIDADTAAIDALSAAVGAYKEEMRAPGGASMDRYDAMLQRALTIAASALRGQAAPSRAATATAGAVRKWGSSRASSQKHGGTVNDAGLVALALAGAMETAGRNKKLQARLQRHWRALSASSTLFEKNRSDIRCEARLQSVINRVSAALRQG